MKILVCGFYDKNNVGDELFKSAFQTLFPTYNFVFTDLITNSKLKGIDVVIFGGGSFLEFEPFVEKNAYESLYTKKILYIGIGPETKIHPNQIKLLERAELISIRSNNLNKLTTINKNVICSPDLVIALNCDPRPISEDVKNKSVLVLPNLSVVPTHKDAYWMHSNWNHFKTEFAQFLDHIIDDGYKVSFAAMSSNIRFNDNSAATEINNIMVHRNSNIIRFSDVFDLISNFGIIITQRYHGAIIAEILNKKYLTIHHHDKLKSAYLNYGNFVSYYNLSKDQLIENFLQLKSNKEPINSNLFEELKRRVHQILGE
jgi:polysaccharide pyruvyl transferase WcaK-like protein